MASLLYPLSVIISTLCVVAICSLPPNLFDNSNKGLIGEYIIDMLLVLYGLGWIGLEYTQLCKIYR